MKLTVLMDNHTEIDVYHLGEPAVSYWLEADGKRFLFDTGYSDAFLKNAKAMGEVFKLRGLDLVAGGTDTHLLLVDLRPKGLTGKDVAEVLETAHITCNKNAIPFDPQSPKITSGIRVGTPAGTTRGFKEQEFTQIAGWICDIIDAMAQGDAAATVAAVKEKVLALCAAFPIYQD